MMSNSEFDLDMDELSSAEDFLDYFHIDYEPSVVHVNRLHILQRFHDYMAQVETMPESDEAKRVLYTDMLRGAYDDFVKSDAITEKVFKVFKMHKPQEVFIPLTNLKI